jgi:protein-disulfide isomerase
MDQQSDPQEKPVEIQDEGQSLALSWELVGILAVLAVFLVMFLIWITSPSADGGLEPPGELTLASSLGLAAGVTDDGRPFLGSPDAPVTFHEFGDFQCPDCRDFAQESLSEIESGYLATGAARMVWVNLPLRGEESDRAAMAAICATDQDRFWDLHDWLFANQSEGPESGNLSRDGLVELATEAGLDAEGFEVCLDDPATAERLEADRTLAAENGVGGTPSFLVGDQLVEGHDVPSLREALDVATE